MGFVLAAAALAADHIDGSGAIPDRAMDLTDVYAFTRDTRDGPRLVAAVAARPYAGRRARFSTEVLYELVFRGATLQDGGVAIGDEAVLSCVFAGRPQVATCRLDGPTPAVVQLPTGDLTGGPDPRLRLYAGVRRDPFFIDTTRVGDPWTQNGERRGERGVDVLHNWLVEANVLAIVVELDPSLLPPGALVAVHARTVHEGIRHDLPRAGVLR